MRKCDDAELVAADRQDKLVWRRRVEAGTMFPSPQPAWAQIKYDDRKVGNCYSQES